MNTKADCGPAKRRFISMSPDETFALGKKLGRMIDSKTVIALSGDLGAGKTLFVQGLSRGLDVEKDCYVTSPTYTIVNEYPGRLDIFHVDLYRLSSPEDLESAGIYEILDSDGVIAVEWADRAPPGSIVPDIDIRIRDMDGIRREITLFFHGLHAKYLVD